jgi:hypothetical protein
MDTKKIDRGSDPRHRSKDILRSPCECSNNSRISVAQDIRSSEYLYPQISQAQNIRSSDYPVLRIFADQKSIAQNIPPSPP